MNNVSEYIKEQSCCGCTACYAVCPTGAISMVENEEGFLFPHIDEEKCVNCGLCKKCCAFNSYEDNNNNPVIYGAKNKNIDTRMQSRSGGVFTALTDYVLENSGVVYGVALDEEFLAYHRRVTTKEDRDSLRGSKYIQSRMEDSLKNVKKDLLDGKKVLFSGTACQLAAVKRYLNNIDCSNLLLVDIVCHGVPSPKIWKDYIQYFEAKYNGKVTSINFRNKQKYGWEGSMQSVTINGTEYDSNLFSDLFNSGVIERKSCFKCPYKSMHRESDITLGDFWGINNVKPEFNDHKGVSLILCNTDKGREFFTKVTGSLDVFETVAEKCKQQALSKANDYPADRDKFWKRYLMHGFRYACLYQWKIKLRRKFLKK